MSGGRRDSAKIAAELVSRGATMLSEPCPQCGGVQLRYHGKVFCTSHDDLSSATNMGAVTLESVAATMREVLLMKLNEASAALKHEKDQQRQEQLASLMAKYFDLLQKLPK